MKKQFTVLGAGSVGIGTAMHLQQRGFEVTLVDQHKPASQTSYGNAGVVNASSYIPLNNPGLLKKLPRLLLNNHAYLRYNLPFVLKHIPWCYHFLAQCTEKKAFDTATALNSLIEGALDEHKALMQRTGNMHRLSESGWLKLMRHSGPLQEDGYEARLYRDFNIPYQILSKEEIYDLEPALKPVFSDGYLLNASASVNNPGQLLREYVDQFQSDGGTFLEQSIASLESSNDSFELGTGDQSVRTENLVICAGPWSADLLEMLGYRVSLGFERGYHQHFQLDSQSSLGRPIHDMDAGYILAPMDIGVRLTTGVELNHRDSASNFSQLEQVIPRAREAVSLGEPTEDPIWRGCRPTFPDSRPVIDRAPRHNNLWMAFGHQHIGLMSGPVTGKLLAQKIAGESTDIDLTPFSANRWVS